MKTLVGKTITITAKAMLGPRQFACSDPRYHLKDYPADMLFQGGFGEMHTRDKSADPAKIAASVGFRGSSWKTLEYRLRRRNRLPFHRFHNRRDCSQ